MSTQAASVGHGNSCMACHINIAFCVNTQTDCVFTQNAMFRCVFQELPEPNRACLVGVW